MAALTAAGCPVQGTRDADLAAIDHPLAVKLRDYRAARKLTGTYGANRLTFPSSNGRIHAGGVLPVLVVHDEIVVEADADRAEATAAWLKQAMLDGMAPLVAPVPVEVEVSFGRTWAGN